MTKPAQKAAEGRKRGSKPAFRDAQRALYAEGLSALDGRSKAARAVKAWRDAVAGDLGGPDALSTAQTTLLEVAARDVALILIADTWIAEIGPRILNRRTGRFRPIVEQRERIATHLAKILKELGLRRVARQVPDLATLMAGGDDAS